MDLDHRPNDTAGFLAEEDFPPLQDLDPLVRATLHDRIRGAIIGSALGDCIGLYTEFLPKTIARDAYPDRKFQLVDPPTKFRNDGHRNKFEPKAWTDDTDHALLILLSYLHHDGKQLSSQDVAERLRSWVSQGLRCLERPPLGLGRTVGTVVLDKEYLANPSLTAYKCWVKSKRTIAPNGSLMRTHPLGAICLTFSLDKTFRITAEFNGITHADPRCVVACCASTALTRGIMRNEVLDEQGVDLILDKVFSWVDAWIRSGRGGAEYLEPDEGELLDRAEFDKHVHAKSFEELQLDDSMKIGYVYKCLGAAILALRLGMRRSPHGHPAAGELRSAIFEDIITELMYEAGDADTNGCAAGALLGCWVGYEALPAKWRDGMAHIQWLVRKCDGFSHILGIAQDTTGYKGSEDPDTRLDGGKGLLDDRQLEKRDSDFMAQYMMRHAEGVAEEKRKQLEREKAIKQKGRSKMFSSITGRF